MGRASEDIGLRMLMEIAMPVIMLAHFDHQNASSVVVNLLKDGNNNLTTDFVI